MSWGRPAQAFGFLTFYGPRHSEDAVYDVRDTCIGIFDI